MRADNVRVALAGVVAASLAATLVPGNTASAGTTGRVLPAAVAVAVPPLPATLPATAPAPRRTKRPNVLVIFTDDMRRDEMRFMPRTRRWIGRAGTTYPRGLSENPLCCPFRAALLTGQYGHNSGVLGNKGTGGGLAALDERRTMNVTLRRRGYTTAWVGKFLNGYPTERTRRARKYVPRGWDEWHVPAAKHYDYRRVLLNRNGRLRYYTGHRADLMGRVGSSVITRLARRRKPFFAAVSFLAPHVGTTPGKGWGPPKPAPRHRGSLRHRMGPLPASFNEEDVTDKPGYIQDRRPLTEQRVAAVHRLRRVRAESLKSVDEAIARQLRALRRSGELRNTIVAFTSDNGLLLGEHRLVDEKRVAYEESVRVPLMIRGPGFRSGARDRRLSGVIDLASTIARAARIVRHLPHPVDGRDLRPRDGRAVLLETGAYLLARLETGAPRSYVGVRTPRFTYVRYWTGEEELYDLREDPGQLDSVHADPHYEADLTRLRAETERLEDCAGAECRS